MEEIVVYGRVIVLRITKTFSIKGDAEKIFDYLVEYFTFKLDFPYRIRRVIPYRIENIFIPKTIIFERGSSMASFTGARIEKCKTTLRVTLTLKPEGEVTITCDYDVKTYGTPLASDIAVLEREAENMVKYVTESGI